MARRRHIALLANRTLSRRSVAVLERELASQGVRATTFETTSFDDGRRTAHRVAAAGVDAIVAAGGDGTVLSVVDAALEYDVPISVLPLGTSNGFARYLGVTSPSSLGRALAHTSEERVDVGFVQPCGSQKGAVPFLTSAGAGVLGEIARRESRGLTGALKSHLGHAAWPLLFSMSWLGLPEARTRISVEGNRLERDLTCFEVCKTPWSLGLAPDAEMDSGVVHAFFFGGLRTRQFVRDLIHCFRRPGLSLGRNVEYLGHGGARRSDLRGPRWVELDSDRPMPVHANGEFVGFTPARFEVTASALRVVAPRPVLTPLPAPARDVMAPTSWLPAAC